MYDEEGVNQPWVHVAYCDAYWYRCAGCEWHYRYFGVVPAEPFPGESFKVVLQTNPEVVFLIFAEKQSDSECALYPYYGMYS